jgi:hypothetical protein
MARAKKSKVNPEPQVLTVESSAMPVLENRAAPSVGAAREQYPGTRLMTASIAGSADGRFSGGGSSFALWCERRGLSPHERRSSEEWDTLLQEFSLRPIHGHRRGCEGGDHSPNLHQIDRGQ